MWRSIHKYLRNSNNDSSSLWKRIQFIKIKNSGEPNDLSKRVTITLLMRSMSQSFEPNLLMEKYIISSIWQNDENCHITLQVGIQHQMFIALTLTNLNFCVIQHHPLSLFAKPSTCRMICHPPHLSFLINHLSSITSHSSNIHQSSTILL